eukprot:3638720-Alexandrium_andersonii.AAC.1
MRCCGALGARPPRPSPRPPSGRLPCALPPGQVPPLTTMDSVADGFARARGREVTGAGVGGRG